MATSGVYSFTVTRDDILRMAALILGLLDAEANESLTSQETTDLAILLNMLMKQWQGKADFAPGLKTFTRRHGHLFLSSNTYRYTVGPGATGWTENYVSTALTVTAAAGAGSITVSSTSGLTVNDKIGVVQDNAVITWTTINAINTGTKVVTLNGTLAGQASANSTVFDYTTVAQQPVILESVFLRDSLNNDTPLRIMTSQEYDFLPSKTQSGNLSDPTAIYLETLKTNSYLYIDAAGASDATKHICMTYLQSVEDVTTATDEVSYPQEWLLPLAYGLAEVAAPIFRVAWTPNMAKNAAASLATAQKKEPEVSRMFFQPGED